MIDTNQIFQAANNVAAASEAATQIKATMSPWMPALAIAAGWAGREISRATAAARNGAEWAMGHGGFFMIGKKLFWNPPKEMKVDLPIVAKYTHEAAITADNLGKLNQELLVEAHQATNADKH